MNRLLNAGNGGHPMGDSTCQLIKSWGFDGVRLSISLYQPTHMIQLLVDELVRNELKGMLIVGGWQVWRDGQEVEVREAHAHEDVAAQAKVVAELMEQDGLAGWIECGNEPDITKNMNHQRFVDQCRTSLAAVRRVSDVPFINGGVSNLSKKGGLKYLRKCLEKGLPKGNGIATGIHPYRTGLKPWDQFEGRYINELYELVSEAAGAISVTEIGWHTAPQTRKVGCLGLGREGFAFTDAQIADFAAWELDTALMNAIDVYVWYQINDGPDPNYDMDRYGVRRFDTFDDTKPVVESFKNWNPMV